MKSGIFVVFHYVNGERMYYVSAGQHTTRLSDAMRFDSKKLAFGFALTDPKYRVGEIESTTTGMKVSIQ